MLHVKWDRDTLHFPFPSLDMPLGQLRADLAAYTQLPVGSFKLVYQGAVMKDEGAPLLTYRLKPGATIALIGGHASAVEQPATPPVAPKQATIPQTEEGTIVAIRAELERVRETLVPNVDAFVRALTGAHVGSPASYPKVGPHATVSGVEAPTPLEHTRLSELLLQSLLRLDAMHMSGVDWPEARLQRKAAVREVQGVLDRLDGAWAGRC